jgi:hypothetical protein
MHGQVLKQKLPTLVFVHFYFLQVIQVLTGMVFVQKVKPILIVDFEVADANLIAVLVITFDLVKNVGKSSGNNTAICVSFSSSRNGEGLTRTRLAIRKYGTIVAIKASINNIYGDILENALLLGQHIKNSIVNELVVVVLDFVVAEAVTLKIELDFICVWSET